MNIEKHKERHQELHEALDELLADFIDQTKALLSKTSLMDFVKWSGEQTDNPTGEFEE